MSFGNYKRKHHIAPFTDDKKPAEEKFLRLANKITTITDDSDEQTDSQVFYDSLDGSAEEILLGRTEIWSVSGQYDPMDPAHQIIHKAKRSDDDGRKVWHKIEETDGTIVVGIAKIFQPVAGGGEASDKEELSCRIAYINKPEITEK